MRPIDPRLLPHLAPARVPLTGALVAGVLGGVLVVAQAFAVAWLVAALLDGDRAALGRAALALLAVTAGRAGSGLLVDLASARASAAVVAHLRRRVLEAALALGPVRLSRRRSGELALLATRGVAAVDPYLTRYLPTVVLASVLPVVTVAAIATQDLLSSLVVLATVPLVPVFAVLVGMATRDRAERQWRLLGGLAGHFIDVVRGLPTLVAFRRAEVQGATIREVTDRYRRATQETLRLAFASSAVLELVATLSVALVAVTVGLRLGGGSLDLRTALVVLLLAPEAYWPLRRLGAEFHAAAEGTAAFEAVEALLAEVDTGGEHTSVTGPRLLLPGVRHEPTEELPLVELREVSVTYAERQAPALAGVTATVPRCGLTALTGPSGAGKSTLLQVLAGELAVSHGQVRVDGAPLPGDPDGLRAWQERVAWLPQRPWLLPGTVRDNVLLGRAGATDAEVWAALERVALGEVVAALPEGLDAPVGEDGAGLSAGERARLALARVVVAGRDLVLLDEPTAHLDPVTEEVVAATLTWLAARSAVVVVAHRPRLVELADHVVAVPPPQPQAARPAPAEPPRAGAATRPPEQPSSAATTTGAAQTERRARRRLRAGVALGSLAAGSGVALTATAGWLIARAAEHPPVLMLMVAIVGVRTFGLARPALRYAERLVAHDAALRLLALRRAAVYDALVPLVPGRLGRDRGDVLTSLVEDVDGLVDQHLRVRAPLAVATVVGGATLALALLVLPAAAAALALVLTTAGLAFLLTRAGVARAEQDHVRARAVLGARVVHVLQGAADLRLWQAAERAVADVLATSGDATRPQERAARAVAAGRALVLVGAGAATAATAWSALAAGNAVRGPVLALLVLLPLALLEVLAPLPDAAALSVRTAAADRRLTRLLAAAPAVVDPAHPVAPSAGPVLATEGLAAGWGDLPALRAPDLVLAPGTRIGVVGPSGSGKSTLAAVLLRFLDPVAGRVTLGGVDLRQLALVEVRRTVVPVDDDPHVFASTLRENLRLARPTATDDELRTALATVRLDAWADALPEGLDTLVGEGHAHVSGGERARIGLARAVLADPDVLVLDEPTAHLDTATAHAVAGDLLDADGGRTVVWITHSPIGLDRMDQLLDLGETAAPGAAGAAGARSVARAG